MEGVILVIVLAIVFFLAGLTIVREEERFVIELFGSYWKTLKPGLNWIFPWIMKVRAVVSIWEQTIPLFETPIKIDFKDGSATPKGAEVFVKIKSPDIPYDAGGKTQNGVYRAIYEIKNWRTAIRDLIENALRTYLNRWTIDEAITMAKAGYDLATLDPHSGLPNKEIVRIKEVLAGWGFELLRITILDFDLDPELLKARGEVQKRKREEEVAKHEKKIRALETMGALIEMLAESTGKTTKEIQEEIKTSPEIRQKIEGFAEELITRQMSIKGRSLTDIRVSGGGDLENSLLRLITALNIVSGRERK